MGFNWSGLKRISHVGAIGTGAGSVRSLLSYVTEDDADAVETSNYFNAAVKELRVGDQILASLDLASSPTGQIYLVTANDGAAVTIAPFFDDTGT